MSQIEIWKDVKGYEGLYKISNLGNVKSLERKRRDRNQILKEKNLKIFIPKNEGYPRVHLCKNGIAKNEMLHRLLAEAFLANDYNLPCVNHIDGNKKNYNLSNLEWCSYSYNNKEACRLGLNKGTSKQVIQLSLDDEVINIWKSGRSAEQYYGITHVADCCNGKRKTSGSYKWKYILKEN